ncbi:MAG: hypothetical protein RL684_150, partial [Pseudomonadota bacterium]
MSSSSKPSVGGAIGAGDAWRGAPCGARAV